MRKIIALFSVGILLVLGGCGSDKIELKQKLFKIEAGEKVSKKTTTYFDGDSSDVKIDFSKVNTKKLGTYAVTAKSGNDKWSFKIQIKDTKSPTLKVTQKEFMFKLGETDLNKVKSEVLSKISVKDNWDKYIDTELLFNNFVMPDDEKKIEMPVIVTDSSGNQSKKVTLTLIFTKDGKKKDNLEIEKVDSKISVGDVNNNVVANGGGSANGNTNTGGNGSNSNGTGNGSNGSGNTGTGGNGNSGGSGDNTGGSNGNTGGSGNTGGNGNTGGGGTLPPVKPNPPERVQTTCQNFKPYPHVLGNTGKCFATLEDAIAWGDAQNNDPSSKWYDFHFLPAGISNYPDWREGEPWTLDAFPGRL